MLLGALARTPIQLLRSNCLLGSRHNLLLLLLILCRRGDHIVLGSWDAVARVGPTGLGRCGFHESCLRHRGCPVRCAIWILSWSLWQGSKALRYRRLRRWTGWSHAGRGLWRRTMGDHTTQRRGHGGGWQHGGMTPRNWRRRSWVLKTAFMILRESGATGRRGSRRCRCRCRRCRGLVCCIIELVPYLIIISTCVLFVESHNIHHCLWVFLLFLLGDTIFLQQPLPFLWQTGELTGLVIISHVRYMHRVLRGRNLDVAR